MKIKIKKLVPEAVIPRYANPGDGGMDVYAHQPDPENGVGFLAGKLSCFEHPGTESGGKPDPGTDQR